MEELARTVGAASQSLMTLPNQMQEMIAGVQNQIDQTSPTAVGNISRADGTDETDAVWHAKRISKRD